MLATGPLLIYLFQYLYKSLISKVKSLHPRFKIANFRYAKEMQCSHIPSCSSKISIMHSKQSHFSHFSKERLSSKISDITLTIILHFIPC